MMFKTPQLIKHFIRGGQITLHYCRMFNQIARWVILLGVIGFTVSWMAWMLIRTSDYQRLLLSHWIWWHGIDWLLGRHTLQTFTQPNGQVLQLPVSQCLQWPELLSVMHRINTLAIKGIYYCGAIDVFMVMMLITALILSGKWQSKNKRITGDLLLDSKRLKKRLTARHVRSDLWLGKIQLPLIKHTENQHFLLDGTTGSGKSTAIKSLLTQIRARGDRAIIWDESGYYLREFYQANTDSLVNDLDERGLPWHLWDECQDRADFESLASALIPMTQVQDPFWVLGARTIFSEVAYAMRTESTRHVQTLLKTLLTTQLDTVKHYLADSYASTLVSDKIEKTAISIKSILAAYLKCLRYVNDQPNAFSIRRWVQQSVPGNWLFLSSQEKKHEALKPLITARLDMAINELLSRTDASNRVWVILDELTSLHKLPSLIKLLAKGRKSGACVMVGVQNYAQLAAVYGHHGARVISSLLNTRLMFRQPDPEMAAWSAKNLGEVTLEAVREGLSYGVNTLRDGVSINRQEMRKPVVSSSEILSLPDLQCYLRLPGDYPVTKLLFDYMDYPNRCANFIARTTDDKNQDKHLDALLDPHDQPMMIQKPEGFVNPSIESTKINDQDPIFEI